MINEYWIWKDMEENDRGLYVFKVYYSGSVISVRSGLPWII
jgi:hypothetical protein